MIEKLTQAQKDRFPEFVEKWEKIGLCTDPANRKVAEKAIVGMYQCAGITPPKKIVWCGSPLSQGLTRAIILDKKLMASVGDSVWASVWASVRDSVGDSVGASVGASVRASVRDSVGDSVWASVWDSVGASVWDSVRDSVRDSVGDSVGDSVWASVRDSVWASVWASVRDSVGASVGASVWDSVGDSVRDSVGASVGASVRDSVRDSVWASVWDSVRASVGASVWDSVGASVRDSVGDSVGDSVWASVWDSVRASVYGQHDAHWLAFYDYFNIIVNLNAQTQRLHGLWGLSKSAGWAIPHKKICWVSERHNILNRDDDGRLHNLTGPAIMYPDGWKIYAVHGTQIPKWIIETPDKITTKIIEKEGNAEIRRIMIDQYGKDKYIIDSGAKEIASDSCGTLFRKDIQNDEPLVMVRVINSTLESDGLSKSYFLRVPPDVRTPREAVAWTFNVPEDQYHPLSET